ncbi:MAG: thiamine phosphate synthase [Bacteroidales bacterium]|nr:thiamine phosphate synthase [Bacteroidales bacterium]
MNLQNIHLQFITHYTEKYSYTDSVKIALEGGCRWIQLRMKDVSETILEHHALIIQEMCKEYGATFIIDDNVHLVKKINADGVHLGKNDMPTTEARRILGDDFIIGGTVNTFEDILKITNSLSSTANSQRPMVNYFGCGPFRFTHTKQKLSPILGIEGYKEIVKKKLEQNIDIPIVAIGGITNADIPHILETGIDGIALSSSILKAENPIEEMKNIVSTIKNLKQ